MPARYAELHALSNFTFLRGASHPEELVTTAAALGYRALELTDECSVAGIVRDMLPNFLDLIDRAVSAVGELDEPEDQNFILKHNRERMAELREDLGEGLDVLRLVAASREPDDPVWAALHQVMERYRATGTAR